MDSTDAVNVERGSATLDASGYGVSDPESGASSGGRGPVDGDPVLGASNAWRRPVDSDDLELLVAELAESLTLEEKVSLLSGAGPWSLPAVQRLGLPALTVSDGPNGIRGDSFITSRSACFPCGSALAATWDPELLESIGIALGGEARAKGVHVLLGPTVNLHRHPLGGRNFESFSEDPELTARVACAYILGVQSQGVACCIKHLVGNESEFQRHSISSEIDEGALRELYLHPFEEAVRAGVWATMAAYNRVGGTYASEHERLLTTVLREEWGFEGATISDWFATHSTGAALLAGLDIEMPGPPRHRASKLLAAVEAGEVPPDAVDRAARRVLRLLGRTAGGGFGPATADSSEERTRELIRRAGARSIVLLKNDGVLPLPASGPRSIALIGPEADRGEFVGGGSAVVNPTHVSDILPALREALPATEVHFERGCVLPDWPRTLSAPLLDASGGEPPVRIEYLRRADPDGQPILSELTPAMRGIWVGEVVPGTPNDQILVRISSTLVPEEDGPHMLALSSTGRSRAYVDGEPLVEQTATAEGDAGFDLRRIARRSELQLVAGVPVRLAIEIEFGTERGLMAFDVALVPPDPPDLMQRAVQAAGEADVAVVVVGSPPGWESEGHDRPTITLPGRQDELVARVAAANPRTVVLVNAGSPVAMPWIDAVGAAVQIWFPGQEMGAAVSDVLTGVVNPSGRLPTSFPRSEQDSPAHAFYPGAEGRAVYGEGLHVGYRRAAGEAGPTPLFAFGHGLTYSTFEYGTPQVRLRKDGPEPLYEISVPVTNVAGPAGREVLQAYLTSNDPARPGLELKGFSGIDLRPGESGNVTIAIATRKLRAWGPGGWERLEGPLTVRIGPASDRLPLEVCLRN